jgi:hypothetical protein
LIFLEAMTPPPSLAVIACAVLEDETRHFAREMPHVREIVILPQGLHREPLGLQRELQTAIDRAEALPGIEAIALVYGLCSRGVENLRHGRCPLVIARAHDCVTLFLGSKERYAAYAREHPGTYWYTPGWIKTGTQPGPDRAANRREEYAAKFDADDVEYLVDMDRQGLAHYTQATYVDIGVGGTAQGMAYTRHCADCLGWSFDQVNGDPSLLRDLMACRWDEDRFLVVPPHHFIRLTVADHIIEAVPETPKP